MIEVDYIIVGQGIAGTMMAHFIEKAGHTFIAYDTPNPHAASRVAGGIMNPITGKRLVKTWLADELIPFAKATYIELEALLGVKLVYEKPLLNFFSNPEDVGFHEEKKGDGRIQPLVIPLPSDLNTEHYIKANLGGVSIKGCVQVDSALLITTYNKHLKHLGKLVDEPFDYQKITIEANGVSYGKYQAKAIVFCEGQGVKHNPWFNNIPLQPAKGEALKVKIDGLPENYIWKKGVFLMATDKNNEYYLGSTNSWKYEDDLPSIEKRNELLEKLNKVLIPGYEVIEHKSAIRPNSKDRRPIIGLHPIHKQMAVFNGFGTKGLSLSPYFAGELINLIEKGEALNTEVNIERFNL